MTRHCLPLVLAALIAGCAPQPPAAPDGFLPDAVVLTPDPPEGWPWKMGTMEVTLDGAAHPYTTYDFSIGAIDASVQLSWEPDADHSVTPGGAVHFLLGGSPGGTPKPDSDEIFVNAVFPDVPASGTRTGQVTVDWLLGPTLDGSKLRSRGPAELTIEQLSRDAAEPSRGQVTGRIRATLCDAQGDRLTPGGACHAFTARFDTRVFISLNPE